MYQLAWPYVLIALILPLFIRLLPARPRQINHALLLPFYQQLASVQQPQPLNTPRLLLALLGWLLLVIAASRPQWLDEPLQLPLSGRDLTLAVDISGSMNTADMVLQNRAVTRLQAVKAIAGEFISQRQGDRLALVLFGSQAYLQAPLTFDNQTVQTLLEEAEIGLAGKETAIGDAIALTVKRLRHLQPEQRVLVLLTDGASNAGAISPDRAIQLASQIGLKIYTIGVGAEEMITQGIFGTSRINPSADLDEDSLRQIASATGGRYFRARDSAELKQIYQLLDQLEPVEKESDRFRPTQELYPWPLAAALLIVLILAISAGLAPSTSRSNTPRPRSAPASAKVTA